MEFFVTQLIMGQIEIQPVSYLGFFTKKVEFTGNIQSVSLYY